MSRLLNPCTAEDYLLRLRADTIADNMRLFRIAVGSARRAGDKWTLGQMFDPEPFEDYKRLLSSHDRASCDAVVSGFVMSNDPNGACLSTDFGTVIVVSHSLEHFLYFFNLAVLEGDVDVPELIRASALQIAIRTMLQKEAMDFERDPRGIIPDGLHRRLLAATREQLKFVIGHEYSHHLLDHLATRQVLELPLRSDDTPTDQERSPSKINVYNTEEVDEFDADYSSIARPNITDEERKNFAYHSLLWFAYLDVFEQVAELVAPLASWRRRTHPPSLDRFHRIAREIAVPCGLPEHMVDKTLSAVEFWRSTLLEDVADHPETYSVYGSVYLGPPNTEWRGRELIDRVDWYF